MFAGSFDGDGGARNVEVRGFGATILSGEKCCCIELKAVLFDRAGCWAACEACGGCCDFGCSKDLITTGFEGARRWRALVCTPVMGGREFPFDVDGMVVCDEDGAGRN